jgi:hypothetical protein
MNIIDKFTVLDLIGGKWPEVRGYEGFSWSDVSHFVIENGVLIPVDVCDNPVPGPSFEIIRPIENPFL